MGRRCPFGLPNVSFVLCVFVILVISHFGFEGETLVLIAPVPGHCLHFYFSMKFAILRSEKQRKRLLLQFIASITCLLVRSRGNTRMITIT